MQHGIGLQPCVCAGERRRTAVCVRRSDHLEVSDQRCEHLPRPVAVAEPCNPDCEVRCALMHQKKQRTQNNSLFTTCSLHLLRRRWHVAGKSECSAKCGPGYRSLDVQCMKYSLRKRQSDRVEASTCGDAAKPQTREPCHGDCLLTSWQYSAWSQVHAGEESSLIRRPVQSGGKSATSARPTHD